MATLNTTSGIVYVKSVTGSALLFSPDNTYDIGANGANRPRNIFVGNTITSAGSVAGNRLYGSPNADRSVFLSTADGLMTLANNAETGFTRLILGTNDASGVAIKKSLTAIHFVLGNDSGPASILCNGIDAATTITNCSGVATPAGGSTSARLLFGTTAGFGIYYGSGAPTVSAAQGSIYLRSDGSTTATRLYVNTNGTTGWTNFTSAA